MPTSLKERVFAMIQLLECDANHISIHTNVAYCLHDFSLDMERSNLDWRIRSGAFLFTYCQLDGITLNSQFLLHIDDFSPNAIIELQCTMDAITDYAENKAKVSIREHKHLSAAV